MPLTDDAERLAEEILDEVWKAECNCLNQTDELVSIVVPILRPIIDRLEKALLDVAEQENLLESYKHKIDTLKGERDELLQLVEDEQEQQHKRTVLAAWGIYRCLGTPYNLSSYAERIRTMPRPTGDAQHECEAREGEKDDLSKQRRNNEED